MRMDYIGSKANLLPFIFGHLRKHMTRLGMDPQDSVFLDACTGTGSVAVEAASQEGFQVIANDLLRFPGHLVRGKLAQLNPGARAAIIEEINGLAPVEGFFTNTYTPRADRRFLTEANASRIDAAREFLRNVPESDIQSYLYYCLIEATSRVSNTAGTHGAFLKDWKDRALDKMTLRVEPSLGSSPVQVFHGDILQLLQDRTRPREDVLYIDPPYVSREYAPNYHLYEALVTGTDPVVRGVTALPQDYPRSDFCQSKANDVGEFLRNVLAATQAAIVMISYSSDGTLPLEDMVQIITDSFPMGACEVQIQRYARYRSGSVNEVAEGKRVIKGAWLREYLLIVTLPEDVVLNRISGVF